MALSQNTKKLIIRIVLFLVYLLVGAAIFQAIELRNERKERAKFPFEDIKTKFLTKHNISESEMNEFLRKLKKAIELGFDLQTGKFPEEAQWHFMNAFVFAGNVVTTIGYGHLVPTSSLGRWFCIFYALVGIPLTGLTLRSVGNRISEEISSIIKGFERKVYNRESDKLEIKTAIIAFILLLVIIIIPAFGFHELEGWSYENSVYFCFVTLSTIGFGDFVTGNRTGLIDDKATNVVLEFLNLIYMVVGLAVMSGVIVSISGVIEEKTKLIAMPDPFETLRVGNLNSKALRKLGMGPAGPGDGVRPKIDRIPPKINPKSVMRAGIPESGGSVLDRSRSADNMDFQGPTPILHLTKNTEQTGEISKNEGSPENCTRPKLLFNNKVVPVESAGALTEQGPRKDSTLSFENRSDSHDEIEREVAPDEGNSRRNTLTEKRGSRNELVVQVQMTPNPSPRSSPAPSPVPVEQEEHSHVREEPTLEINEKNFSSTPKGKPTNGNHLINNDLPPVEVLEKNASMLNGFANHAAERTITCSENETLEMKQPAPINR